MRKSHLAVILSLVVVIALAVWLMPRATQAEDTIECTLTGKTLTECCCDKKADKTYCPLADKTLEECCCVPLQEGAKDHS